MSKTASKPFMDFTVDIECPRCKRAGEVSPTITHSEAASLHRILSDREHSVSDKNQSTGFTFLIVCPQCHGQANLDIPFHVMDNPRFIDDLDRYVKASQ